MKKVLGVIRAPFLLLTPVCVSVGAAAALAAGGQPAWHNLSYIIIAAVAAHISVNALNEYADFRSGLDQQTVKTPFSGGSGILLAYPDFALPTLYIGIAALLLSIVCGFYLFAAAGWGLLPLGLLGAITVATYTPWINRNAVLCLLAPGIGFGTVMVLGSAYALTSAFDRTALWASLPPMLLVSNLLLLNQFPDVEADRSAGRRHLPIQWGRPVAARVFGVLLLLAYALLVLAVALHELPAFSLLALTTAPLAILVFVRVRQFAEEPSKLVPWMGLNVALVLLTPLLLAVGMWVGAR